MSVVLTSSSNHLKSNLRTVDVNVAQVHPITSGTQTKVIDKISLIYSLLIIVSLQHLQNVASISIRFNIQVQLVKYMRIHCYNTSYPHTNGNDMCRVLTSNFNFL